MTQDDRTMVGEMLDAGSGIAITLFEPSTISITVADQQPPANMTNSSHTNVTECHAIKKAHMDDSKVAQDFIQPLDGVLIIRLLLAALVLLVNVLVVVALLRSWHKLRQNIYIFALNIAICDAFLGLVYLGNSVHHLSVEDRVHTTDDGKCRCITLIVTLVLKTHYM